MGYRGRGRGQYGLWPGNGPFSYLPPWQRPGWLYGRGSCWYLYSQYLQGNVPSTPIPSVTSQPHTLPFAPATSMPPALPFASNEQEKAMLEQYIKNLETQLSAIRKRLEEIKE